MVKADSNAKKVLKNKEHPYYIFAPDFISTSAGIKALYILCDRLNKHGYPAYIISSNRTSDQYRAPLLSLKINLKHLFSMKTPIVVYPEVVRGNPWRASFYVRYFFCFNAHFGVDLKNDKANIIYSFSRDICDDVVKTDNIMFIPTIDLSVFYPPENPTQREGTCYAAMKYKYFHHEEIYGLPENSIEITRDLPHSQSREEIANLFRKCKYFYCFDNTALALEATLCGCITILMRNKHFTRVIGHHELRGLPGMAWCDDEEGIAKAENTIKDAYKNYLNIVDNFENEIDHFIHITQTAIQKESLAHAISFYRSFIFFIKNLSLFFIRDVFMFSAKKIFKRVYRKIFWHFPWLKKPIRKMIRILRREQVVR